MQEHFQERESSMTSTPKAHPTLRKQGAHTLALVLGMVTMLAIGGQTLAGAFGPSHSSTIEQAADANPAQSEIDSDYLKSVLAEGSALPDGFLDLYDENGDGCLSVVDILLHQISRNVPTIQAQPLDCAVMEGQPATFSVTASGNPAPTFQWSKNGTDIQGASSSTYTLPAATMADSRARFTVVVSNSAGSVASRAATLFVTPFQEFPAITTQPQSVTVTEGQPAAFSVAASGTPSPQYQWVKNGTAIAGAISPVYTTPATTSADSGARFMVLVSNSAGSISSNVATLTVTPAQVAPVITGQPHGLTVTKGQTATFSVTATGTPSPTYQWRKNGTDIQGASSSSYRIPNATMADSGARFTVVVSNGAGSATSDPATLTVVPVPPASCHTPQDPMSYQPGPGGTLYEIGPGKASTSTHDIALHRLKSGDVVRIYAKNNREPYYEKLYIAGEGTADHPIVVVGVPDAQGNKPIFSGINATANTHYGRYYYNEDRQVIVIGQYGNLPANHLILDNFEVTGAVAQGAYKDTQGWAWYYGWNAASVMVQHASDVTIRRCDIHHSENGIFASNNGLLTVEYSYIHDNGVHTGSDQQHNLYINGGAGSVFTLQFCHIGEELNDGQQVKSRAETTVIRHNWIEGGRNSLLDLVEESDNGQANAYVYGNILIKVPPVHNKRIVFFGGDISQPRTGTLYFFNNTVVNLHDDPAFPGNNFVNLFMLNRPDAKVIADNNILYSAKSSRIKMYDASNLNNLSGSNNWISSSAELTEGLMNSVRGKDPGFRDFASGDFFLTPGSPARDFLSIYMPPPGHDLNLRYEKHELCGSRGSDGKLDLGALE